MPIIGINLSILQSIRPIIFSAFPNRAQKFGKKHTTKQNKWLKGTVYRIFATTKPNGIAKMTVIAIIMDGERMYLITYETTFTFYNIL